MGIFKFNGLYLKLGCSQRLAVADMFCSTLCWACADVFLVFLQKKLSEMANFLAPCRKSFSCLCQFRLFIFQLTFTGGNPWPKLVPAIPFGMKSGVFFCLQFENSLCLLRSSIYTCTEIFIFGSPFNQKFKFFGQNGAQSFRSTARSMSLQKFGIFHTFSVLYHELFCVLHISKFEIDRSF